MTKWYERLQERAKRYTLDTGQVLQDSDLTKVLDFAKEAAEALAVLLPAAPHVSYRCPNQWRCHDKNLTERRRARCKVTHFPVLCWSFPAEFNVAAFAAVLTRAREQGVIE